MTDDPGVPGEPAAPPPLATMPMMLGPSRLRPVELDLQRVFWVGVVLWCVAGVVAAALAAAGRVEWRTVVICGAGLGLGLLAVVWARRRERHR